MDCLKEFVRAHEALGPETIVWLVNSSLVTSVQTQLCATWDLSLSNKINVELIAIEKNGVSEWG